jgi:hypothetical protein
MNYELVEVFLKLIIHNLQFIIIYRLHNPVNN